MVTITIGGNDVGFAKILQDCAVAFYENDDATCSETDLEDCEIAVNQNNLVSCEGEPLSYEEVFDELGERVVAVLARIKQAAPRASVFLLGYPYVTPVLEPCGGLTRAQIMSLNSDYEDRRDFDTTGLSDQCVYRLVVYFESFRDCESLDAREVAHAKSGGWSFVAGPGRLARRWDSEGRSCGGDVPAQGRGRSEPGAVRGYVAGRGCTSWMLWVVWSRRTILRVFVGP